MRRGGLSKGRIAVVVIALLIINVPFLIHVYEERQVTSNGVRVTATVLRVTPSGSDAIIDFRLPHSIDSSGKVRSAKVHGAEGDRASSTRSIGVRVLKGNPSVFHVDGEVSSRGPLILTLVADVVVVFLILFAWGLRGRIRRPPLEAVALDDVHTGDEGSLLDKQIDGTYVIQGEVAKVADESIVLALRDRDVTVHLRGYQNEVGVGEQAQVRAHLVG
jgi:hypothetical protein